MKAFILIIGFFTVIVGAALGQSGLGFSNLNGAVDLRYCSGSVVKFENQPVNSKAYLLTNGHCVAAMQNIGTAHYMEKIFENFEVFDAKGNLHQTSSSILIYSTMTGTDLALYHLDESINELENQQILVRTIDPKTPSIGDKLNVISGLWKEIYECQIDKIVHQLKEDQWIFHQSYSLVGSDCLMMDGASGSPMISKATGMVVGVWNTSNERGKQCQYDDPCEISKSGKIATFVGRRYGQEIQSLYTCLNSNFEIDLNQPGCQLEKNIVPIP